VIAVKDHKELMLATTESDRYLELLQQFPPRPIKSEEEFLAVQDVMDNLLDVDKMTLEQRDYLDVLGILVHEYEEKNVLMPDLSGVELLEALMDEFGIKPQDLNSVFQAESVCSEVLGRERELTVEHIEKLAGFFKVSPSTFFSQSS
jgi:HTH-type transcriptional regulator / antitoxin HigA